jgi:hypothetical protein
MEATSSSVMSAPALFQRHLHRKQPWHKHGISYLDAHQVSVSRYFFCCMQHVVLTADSLSYLSDALESLPSTVAQAREPPCCSGIIALSSHSLWSPYFRSFKLCTWLLCKLNSSSWRVLYYSCFQATCDQLWANFPRSASEYQPGITAMRSKAASSDTQLRAAL